MEIFFNGNSMPVSINSSLYDVLKQSSFADKKGIAVAVNNTVISRDNWEGQKLNTGDKVLVISATKGG